MATRYPFDLLCAKVSIVTEVAFYINTINPKNKADLYYKLIASLDYPQDYVERMEHKRIGDIYELLNSDHWPYEDEK